MRVYLFKYSNEVEGILKRATREFSRRLCFLKKIARAVNQPCARRIYVKTY